MDHQLSLEDQNFKRQFEACITTPADFNHQAHIRIAYIYLCQHEPDIAYQNMRNALLTFLSHYTIDPAKFHETLTQAWILGVHHFMVNTAPATSADDFMSQNPKLLNSKIMLTHYSEKILFSEKARQAFIEPDLDVIPRYTYTVSAGK